MLFTHDHADHTHGVDDIRAITVRRDAPLPDVRSAGTLDALAKRFPYIFDENIRPAAGNVEARRATRGRWRRTRR